MNTKYGRSLTTAVRYSVNTVNLARRQEGWPTAARTAIKLSTTEARKIPRLVRFTTSRRTWSSDPAAYGPVLDIPEILRQLAGVGADVTPHPLNRSAIDEHMRRFSYPRFYAGGSRTSGGFRESKILEYFVSLDLVPVEPSDVVIDVASERSIFPDMVSRTITARVLRQDLTYAPGFRGDRIGGSAAEMPLPPNFADKLFLHNSFEHFEEDIDSRFITEAWRVLKPGGAVCIVPLYMSTKHQILTDPLLRTDDVHWDPGAEIVRRIGHRNRFGRFYDAPALAARVLQPAIALGFTTQIFYFEPEDPASYDPVDIARLGLQFALLLSKT